MSLPHLGDQDWEKFREQSLLCTTWTRTAPKKGPHRVVVQVTAHWAEPPMNEEEART
jgi:hypothetical protein